MSEFLPENRNSGTGIDHWQRLAVLLKHSPVVAASLMRCPCPALPFDTDILEKVTDLARAQCLEFLLLKHLCSCLALQEKNADNELRHPLGRLVDKDPAGIPVENLLQANWTSVPVLVCQGNAVSTVWFMLGCFPGNLSLYPLFAPLPAPKTVDAVHCAFIAAQAANPEQPASFYFFSLQDEMESPVTGSSLGLPFGLAMSELVEGRGWPDGCYATGELADDGRLLSVGQVAEKFKSIEKRSRLFLFPESSPQVRNSGHAVSCGTLHDAGFVLRMIAGGAAADRVDLYRACLRDGHVLLSQFAQLPPQFFSMAEVRTLLLSIREQPEIFLRGMSQALAGSITAGQQAGAPLADLLTPEQIVSVVEKSGLLAFDAFKWVVSRISFANHCGDVSDVHPWYKLAEQLREKVTDDEIFAYLNHRFVGERFNRYDFRPQLPDEFSRFIHEEEQRNAASPRDNRNLGAVYGTIAQNYGFCGPAYLDHLHSYAKRSAAAFGRKFSREAMRLQVYIIYGLLDAEEFDQAGEVLDTYLNLEKNSSRNQQLEKMELMLQDGPGGAYPVAVTARFLADTSGEPPSTSAMCHLDAAAQKIMQYHHHPWQLSALNLGRLHIIAGQLDSARRLFRHGLAICSSGDQTMQVMALLFLSELHQHGFANKKDYFFTESLVKLTLDCTLFNSSHFKTIHQVAEAGQVLEIVSATRKNLFPFSYR